jgi:hypothetical protein
LRRPIRALLLLIALAVPAAAAELTPEEGYPLVQRLMSDSKKERREAARRLIEAGDLSLVPAMVDAVFFTPRLDRAELLDVLEALTGESHDGYYQWVEYVGANEQIEPKARYIEWKVAMLSRIDEAYRKVLYPGAPARVRLEEVVSGGVPVAGIPALDNPPHIPAAEASYLRKRERVFGVELGGEARAYPLRILDWHELMNDVVGGEPVTLSYCTLCGSGILYDTRAPSGKPYIFDTSGLLYRSNKLMLDRQTFTLWSNLLGEPVIGRLAGGSARLEVLPMTLTTWETWLADHPDTRVLDLKAIEKEAGRKYGFDYVPGAADRARTGVSFPIWLKSDSLERDREVFTLRVNGAAKAYPVDRVLVHRVINDELGGLPIVIVGDPESGSIRAYRRGDREFSKTDERARVRDRNGKTWVLGEHSLTAANGGDGSELERLPGHVAFWFGWYAFYPQTAVFDG